MACPKTRLGLLHEDRFENTVAVLQSSIFDRKLTGLATVNQDTDGTIGRGCLDLRSVHGAP
jgi:hypothetical protein